ncbi:MAG: protein-export chaperone SecB [Clostridia bacterium]|jgi:preprotein translocase subunit SecB|nr:protein-export chaperone SecB [Clostridia bacterium]
MIDYTLKGLTADELYFKVNPIKATAETKFEIKPLFSRQIRQANENPEINVVMLECKIETKEDEPKPFNLTVRLMGVFEVKNMNNDDDRRIFAINATETMFPYLRAAVTNLTADALVNPLTLPVVPGSTLFPEDRGTTGYTLNIDPNSLN